MKKLSTLALALLSLSTLNAQTPFFSTSQDIDINNIKAAHLVHGDMWWNPSTAAAACEFPKGSGKNLSHATSLWIGGYDNNGNLKVSAQTYRQNGNDYWPGPIDTTTNSATLYTHESAWAKIWKVNKSSIDSFKANATHAFSNTPIDILTWPALGNPYAQGNGGATLTITNAMAPFVDVDGNGTYNATMGDYPLIKGDQMLWWIINDAGSTHNLSQTSPLRIEIQHSVYAYKRGGLIDNMVFYEYNITNRSSSGLDSLRLGMAADLDLGDGFDDLVGFDSTYRMGIQYNGKQVDGSGQTNSYGSNIPMVGVAMVELPGDNGTTYVPAGSFMSYDNGSSANGNPGNAVEMYNLLNSTNRAGVHLPNGKKYQYGISTECDLGNTPFDRRFVIASNSISLPAGATTKIAMALVVSPDAGGCPVMNFTGIQATADSAWIVYHHPPQPLGISNPLSTQNPLRIYPNPANNSVFVEPANGHTTGAVSVYDAIGKSISLPVKTTSGKIEINTSSLAQGVYMIFYKSNEGTQVARFTKQ